MPKWHKKMSYCYDYKKLEGNMKKRQIFYIDKKFIRKFGMENKYFNAERQSIKNNLQILKDFSETVNSLKEIV